MDELPEFRVKLTRLKPGLAAYPTDIEKRDRYLGRRSKFGGKPDWEQGHRGNPRCRTCKKPMTFVAQIDSIEHNSGHNPHGVDWRTKQQKWMFGDVGLIYVFFCFDCLE